MSESSKKEADAAPSSAPASPAGEMPEAADSRLLGAPASRWPFGSQNPEHAGETPALPGTGSRAGLNDRWLVTGICVFLAAIVWVVFGQTLGHEFVNYDDDVYVYDNLAVTRGLSLKGVECAFTHIVGSNWHPLTMMSHMLDCQLYGLNPGGHHLTNVLLHTASAILLFLVLRQMTGLLWRSAFVAAVFAIHPLRVESVAWVAERKDVLSGLFFMLTLWAYTRYAQGRSSVECRASGAGSSNLALDPRLWTLDYGLVLLFFTLGLMSKPMLVTLPFVLLLLDYWPLGRVAGGGWRVTGEKKGKPSTLDPQLPGATTCRVEAEQRRERSEGGSSLLLEKLPLLGLAAASCGVTIFAQHAAIQPFEPVSQLVRTGNALISYVAYMSQMFWPSSLAVLYPFAAGSVGVLEVVLSLVLLAGISTGVFILRRRCPCFLTGWLWYIIMLAPVIGILQVGSQARADRYTYLPQIGLYLLLTWAAAELCGGWRHRRRVLGGLATVILVALIYCAREQTAYWRNSESLWTHTVACTSDNFIAHNNLGNALLKKGNVDEAIAHFQKVLQIRPGSAEAHNNLGNALLQKGNLDVLQKGNLDEAIVHFQKALEIKPDSAQAHNNLGNVLLQKRRVDEAIAQYQEALQLMPDAAEARINLGSALLRKGRVDEAIAQYQQALEIKPDSLEAHINLGSALLQKGRVDEAITHFQKALQLKPDSLSVLNNLAWLLATSPDAHVRDGVQAVQYAERACELTHYGVTRLVGTLAAAYAEAGRFDDAIATAQKACALAEKSGEPDLLKKNQELLALYRNRQPYHEAAEKVVPAAP